MKEMKVIIAGPRGRMGHEAVLLMERTEHFNLVAAVDYKHGGEKISDLPGMPALDAPIYADLHTCLEEVEADVLLDLTTPEVGKQHVTLAVERGLRSVIGTTGFTEEELKQLTETAKEKDSRNNYRSKLCNWCSSYDEILTNGSEIFPRC